VARRAGEIHVEFLHGRDGRFEIDSDGRTAVTGSFPFFPLEDGGDHG
jgi:hypothetical protein